MQHFGSEEDVARSFVKAYFSTLIQGGQKVERFYLPDALIARNGRPPVKSAGSDFRDLVLPVPSDSILKISQYNVVRVNPTDILLVVAGVVRTGGNSKGFSETFVLRDLDDRIWIVSDIANYIDADFLEAIDAPPPESSPVPASPSPSAEVPSETRPPSEDHQDSARGRGRGRGKGKGRGRGNWNQGGQRRQDSRFDWSPE
jgi:hypothetical protein